MIRVDTRMGDMLTSIRQGEYTANHPHKYANDWNNIHGRAIGSSRKKSLSFDSAENGNINDEFGWFDDIESNVLTAKENGDGKGRVSKPGAINAMKTLSLPLPASNPPSYVLESRVETQHLWYETAGQRPQQPRHEREYFESLWKRNFENSKVDYSDSLKSPSELHEDENMRVDVDGGVIINRGRGKVFHLMRPNTPY